MDRYFGSEKFARLRAGTVVALGNFDGVHLGHRYIIERTIGIAKRLKAASVVYTFDPHPVRILAPESCPKLIQTIGQRLSSLEALGIDACVVETFTHDYAQQRPDDFFTGILIGRLGAISVVVGYDFTFGYHRGGTVELLERLGKERGVEIIAVEAQFAGEALLSSSEIRHFIASGRVEDATALLGRHYALEGKVVSGKGLGGYLGAHTANIAPANELLPGSGVYITVTGLGAEKKKWPSVTSVGTNPTFPGGALTVETHLIGFEGDLLGRVLEVEFIKKMRDQIAFPSVEKLHDRIAADIEKARKFHEKNGTL